VWLLIDSINNDAKYHHIFSKGDVKKMTDSDSGRNTINNINGPGVYFIRNSNENTKSNLKIIMDVLPNGINDDTDLEKSSIDVTNIPLKKWFNLTFRLENKIMDVYVNGTISNRKIFENVPLQNYYDVQVCQNSGFNGKLSNLRYFSYSLNIFEINTLVLGGPNLQPGQISSNINKVPDPTFSYISNLWYTTNRSV
jgi:hypothetical protein